MICEWWTIRGRIRTAYQQLRVRLCWFPQFADVRSDWFDSPRREPCGLWRPKKEFQLVSSSATVVEDDYRVAWGGVRVRCVPIAAT